MSDRPAVPKAPEWGTFALILGCYGGWAAALFVLPGISIWLAFAVATFATALHSSLTHEALHGHPFRSKALNEALMALPLTLAIPYNRFRDLHLAHHRDANLTDPYDDPETNFFDPNTWAEMTPIRRRILALNNTLLGRMILGPVLGQISFMGDDWRLARSGDRAVILAWAVHVPGVVAVIWLVAQSHMALWLYLLAVYTALGLLKIRTFLEHQAHEKVRGRSVIIEDRGVLAFLFLNNNLHVVHHMHPTAPWYQLPKLYRRGKPRYIQMNDGYVFRSYGQVFRRFFLKAKDPVPHPLWPTK